MEINQITDQQSELKEHSTTKRPKNAHGVQCPDDSTVSVHSPHSASHIPTRLAHQPHPEPALYQEPSPNPASTSLTSDKFKDQVLRGAPQDDGMPRNDETRPLLPVGGPQVQQAAARNADAEGDILMPNVGEENVPPASQATGDVGGMDRPPAQAPGTTAKNPNPAETTHTRKASPAEGDSDRHQDQMSPQNCIDLTKKEPGDDQGAAESSCQAKVEPQAATTRLLSESEKIVEQIRQGLDNAKIEYDEKAEKRKTQQSVTQGTVQGEDTEQDIPVEEAESGNLEEKVKMK